MKKLSDKVNLVPIIAKADTITKPELEVFKKKVSHCIDLILEPVLPC